MTEDTIVAEIEAVVAWLDAAPRAEDEILTEIDRLISFVS